MSVLNVQAKGSTLLVEKSSRITSGGRNTVELRVNFDDNWDCKNGKFFASFYIDNPEDAYLVELNRNPDGSFSCIIPDEIIENEGFFHFGVWCESGDKLKPSDIKVIRVYQGIVTKGHAGYSATVEAIETILNENNVEGEDTVNKVANVVGSLTEIEKLIDESGVIEYDNSF